jgi:hypothetical protein
MSENTERLWHKYVNDISTLDYGWMTYPSTQSHKDLRQFVQCHQRAPYLALVFLWCVCVWARHFKKWNATHYAYIPPGLLHLLSLPHPKPLTSLMSPPWGLILHINVQNDMQSVFFSLLTKICKNLTSINKQECSFTKNAIF